MVTYKDDGELMMGGSDGCDGDGDGYGVAWWWKGRRKW